MARPPKVGLDYYSMDVGFLRDKKIKLLQAEFGASSVVFVLYVFGKAYEGDGYFLTWDKDECLLAADALQKPPTYINEVLQGCLSRSLFDKRVFQMFHVLTSAGIQRRYIRGCEKRSKIFILSEYWLLSIDSEKDVPASIRAKLAFFSLGGGNNPINSPGNPVNSPGNPQSKVKEMKGKDSKALAPPAGGWGFGNELNNALSEWLAYKKERRQPYEATSLKNLTDMVRGQAEIYGEKAIVDLLHLCMANNWQGIAWDKLGKTVRSSRPSGARAADDARADLDRMEKYLEELRKEQENGSV